MIKHRFFLEAVWRSRKTTGWGVRRFLWRLDSVTYHLCGLWKEQIPLSLYWKGSITCLVSLLWTAHGVVLWKRLGCLRCWGRSSQVFHQSSEQGASDCFWQDSWIPCRAQWLPHTLTLCNNLWSKDTVTLTRHIRHMDVSSLVPGIPGSSCIQRRVRLHLLCSVSSWKQCWYQ